MDDLNPTLVLAGAWNPAIIQPNWLSEEVFGATKGDEVKVSMMISTALNNPIKFVLNDIVFTPSGSSLIIEPDKGKGITPQTIEEVGKRILNVLPHTPFLGFGENFRFEFLEPEDSLVELFNFEDRILSFIGEEARFQQTKVARAIKLNDCVLNLVRTIEDTKVTVEFNFHYAETSAAIASNKINNTFSKNLDRVKKILNSYGAAL